MPGATAAHLASRTVFLTLASIIEISYFVETIKLQEVKVHRGLEISSNFNDRRKDVAAKHERIKRYLQNGPVDGENLLSKKINNRLKRYVFTNGVRKRHTGTLPSGIERITEVSQYLSSESVSFYSHEDTTSEQRMVYGHPDSSYSFMSEVPENELDPYDMVQILQTKCLDPFLSYKAVAADHELKPPFRMGAWDKLHLHPLAVYRALMNFNSTKEAIYRSLKKAYNLKLFTAPPKEIWKALHYDDSRLEENLEKLRRRKGWTTPSMKVNIRNNSVSPSDKKIIQNFKTQSRLIAHILRNHSIDYHVAYEVCRLERINSRLESNVIFKQMGLKPDDIYDLTVDVLKMSRLGVYRALKYLAQSTELIRKPLGAKPEHDGGLHPQLYEQYFAVPSEEDASVLENYIRYTPKSITVKKFG